MEKLLIKPHSLTGTVKAPPSKSDGHRAIICAALSMGKSIIHNVSYSNDINATIDCMTALGAKINKNGSDIFIDSTKLFENTDSITLDCGESGSTLRFLIPVSVIHRGKITFIGQGRLPQRPIGIYTDILPAMGVTCTTQGGLPLTVDGTLESGIYRVPGNISSQFITGLLLALPMLQGDSEIVITTALESLPYINMTINCMKKFGVIIDRTDNGFYIKGNQSYTPMEYTIEGDWSQAAFFMCAGAIQNEITLTDIQQSSLQGDREICNILKRFGATVTYTDTTVTVKHNELKGITLDARQIPDLVPIIAITASLANGKTIIKNAERLRIKESDRIKTTADAISNLGGKVTQTPDGLIIEGVKGFASGEVDGANDHRILMATAIGSSIATGEVTVTYPHCINKSYPSFYEDFNSLGGEANVINIG